MDGARVGLVSIRAKPSRETVSLLVAGWSAIQGQTLQLPSPAGHRDFALSAQSSGYEQMIAPGRLSHFARHVYNICT
jgi:hypothetical protein